MCRMESVKLVPVHHIVLFLFFFSYSALSGLLGSDGKQNTA